MSDPDARAGAIGYAAGNGPDVPAAGSGRLAGSGREAGSGRAAGSGPPDGHPRFGYADGDYNMSGGRHWAVRGCVKGRGRGATHKWGQVMLGE